jgi:hypothetical protein
VTATKVVPLDEMEPGAMVELIQASARCYLNGLRPDPTTGEYAFGDLAAAIDSRECGPFAMLGAWRLVQGLPSTLADIDQIRTELYSANHVLEPFAEAAGYSIVDLGEWSDEIFRALLDHPDDLSIAARLCAEASRKLADGAKKVQRKKRLSKSAAGWVTLFSRRAEAFAGEPNEYGAYLDDDLILFDFRYPLPQP